MLLIFACIVIVAVTASAQMSQVERDFETRKAKFTFEHFSEGEDASSGFDYLFYKNGSKIVKIRSIWSASHTHEMRVSDFYFDGTELLFFREFTASDRLLNALKKGRSGTLVPKEEFHFAAGKLTKWIVGGKAKSRDDSAWAESEKNALEQAKSHLESYGWLKEGK
ncbi:MAG: hypothetical protein DMF63_12965 [Acidobacteria bacterium]|nr:MAG: hypothetical protein DMF63_12965 [Acidobacteriota bacterium]